MSDTEFMVAVKDLVSRIDATIPEDFDGIVEATCVGGVAVHYHTGHRVSGDCAMIFDHRLILPSNLVATWQDASGERRALAFDTNYASKISLLHPYATDEADPVDKIGRVSLKVLNPVDLAVTKVGRWMDLDREDLRALAGNGLLDPQSLQTRANEALSYYIGDRQKIEFNLRDALEDMNACQPSSDKPPNR